MFIIDRFIIIYGTMEYNSFINKTYKCKYFYNINCKFV